MSKTFDKQINQLKQTIVEMESQRAVLGDKTVDAALDPLYKKLAEFESLVEPSVVEEPELPTRQRKLVTLLYMDVVGSTAMTQHLDPEDTLEIMDNALPRLAAPIELHGGHVTRYTGDGFKAVFGDPIAREDDPEQAIRAGLDILEVSQAYAQELEAEWRIEDFKVRIGIDTGLAALGGQTEAEDTVMGRVVNLAVRIESAAPPGGMFISHNTYRHVRGVFDVQPQEPITAKGFADPVPAYLVLNVKPRAFRVITRGVEGVETRMVGREAELKYLQDALLTAIEEGEGQVVTVSGEAGVGKSRLLYEFQNWFELLPQIVRLFQGKGRHESQGQPYSLLRDLFTFRFQILDNDSGKEVRRKIENGFGDVFGNNVDALMRAHILGQLLGFDFSVSPHLKGVLNDPEQLRNRGLMYLKEYFQILSQENPAVILFEDIHWADETSLDAVNQLGEYSPQLPFVIVCAARPTLFERRPYWGEGESYHTLLELRPLSKRESRHLVTEILKLAEEVPTELRELVVGGAEGNPFYVEELIKMLIEDNVVIPGQETWLVEMDLLEQVDVPSTLAGVLQARLDSLPNHERTVLQQASVVGRLFWDRIVAYIQAEGGNGDDPQLIPLALISLRNRELVYRHEESAFVGTLEYIFKHDVLREVTYESVLKRLRKIYHGLVADWLIANGGDRIGEFSGLIGEHLQYGGRNGLACEYFDQAGESAIASFANSEAEDYFRMALELSPPERMRAGILSGLGEALRLQGLNEEAEKVFRIAIQLYHKLGNIDSLGDIYSRLSMALWRIDYHQAWNVCQEGLEFMEGAPDSLGYARLLAEGGRTALFSSEGDQVMTLCKQAIEMAKQMGDIEVQGEASNTIAVYKTDEKESIAILEEVIAMAEANRLWSTAARAHNNIGAILNNLYIDRNSAGRHTFQAAEIGKQIGDIEGMLFSLRNIHGGYISSGELNTLEEKVVEFLQSSTASKTQVENFLQVNRPYVMKARGEWLLALEARKDILKELHERGGKQEIFENNYDIAGIILELNRFGHHVDLSEAESALLENIEQSSSNWLSRFRLVIVYIRQRRLTKAHKQYDQAIILLPQTPYWITNSKEIRSEIQFEFSLSEERWGEAIKVCESYIEIYQRSNCLWELARLLIDLGDALVGRNEPGDLQSARETYHQSLDMFTEMGAPGYIQVLEERLGDL